MRFIKNRNSEDIVSRLTQEFWAKHQGELTQKLGEITQDHINRGLHGSTARVSKLIGAHYDLIDKLIDFLIDSLEKNYPYIPPSKCKGQLFTIAEAELDKVARRIPGWLNESQLLNLNKSFDSSIQQKKDKTKNYLDNKCCLWEERWQKRKKWYTDPKWISIAIATIGLIATIISSYL